MARSDDYEVRAACTSCEDEEEALRVASPGATGRLAWGLLGGARDPDPQPLLAWWPSHQRRVDPHRVVQNTHTALWNVGQVIIQRAGTGSLPPPRFPPSLPSPARGEGARLDRCARPYVRVTSRATVAISGACSRSPTTSMRAVACLALMIEAVKRRNLSHTSSQVKELCGDPLWGCVDRV
jgi:hypothetical protein